MRLALIALLAACLGACASFGRAPVSDLAPAIENARAYDGQVFEGEVYVVTIWGRALPSVATSLDAETYIDLDNWSARRLHNYYGYRHGHRIRIRAIIREERIIVTQAATAGQCAPMHHAATFQLTQVRVLRGPAP